jgi:hypothetical protein
MVGVGSSWEGCGLVPYLLAYKPPPPMWPVRDKCPLSGKGTAISHPDLATYHPPRPHLD